MAQAMAHSPALPYQKWTKMSYRGMVSEGFGERVG